MISQRPVVALGLQHARIGRLRRLLRDAGVDDAARIDSASATSITTIALADAEVEERGLVAHAP